MTINLSFRTVLNPDFGGWIFSVDPQTDTFDAHDYAEAYNINVNDIDVETIKCVSDAVNNNFGGSNWIEVTHEEGSK